MCYVFQVNLKPSALKNEYNALLHFIKFAKRTRNMATTNLTLNSSLDNLHDIMMTFLEGAQKKICKDRNLKTTANIQNGLPHTVSDVLMQFQDVNLLKRVSMICSTDVM